MCNRYSKAERKLVLASEFGIIQTELEPRYNIAPTQIAPVAVVRDGVLTLQDLRWGFEGFTGQPVMNARAETAHEKQMFREAWRQRHCLVPADGFYEWKQMSDGKQPYRFVKRDGETFCFAGLWQDEQFTIMTAPARGCVAEMHDRMPIILRENDLDWWLGDEAMEGKELIARAGTEQDLECYPVKRRMSNSRYILADCIERISVEEKQLGLL